MEVERKDIDKLNAEITITVKEADYKDKVEKSLKEYRKQANMPGFRKGHVPLGMVRKMVGTNMLVEEVNGLLRDKLYGYIQDEKLDILGNPLPKEEDDEPIDWENQKDFSFTYEIGLAPEVKVDLSEKDKLDKYEIKVSDKMVEEQIGEMAKRFGKMVEVEKSEKGDMLYGKFEELEDGKVKEEGISNSTVLNINIIKKDKDQKKFVGLKVGDVVGKLKLQELADSQYVAAWLGVDAQYLPDEKTVFQYTVEKINRMEPAALNQEFFDKIYGKDVVKTKAEMAEKVKSEIQASLDQNAEQFFERDVQDYLMDKAKLELPDAFMKKWLKATNEQNITDEQIEADYDNYALGIRWQLIENKLMKEHDIKVEQEEILDYTINLIRQQLAGMGQNMMEDEELKDTAIRVLQNQEEARRIYEQLSSAKLSEFYNKTAKIKKREISYDEFVKLAEKKK